MVWHDICTSICSPARALTQSMERRFLRSTLNKATSRYLRERTYSNNVGLRCSDEASSVTRTGALYPITSLPLRTRCYLGLGGTLIRGTAGYTTKDILVRRHFCLRRLGSVDTLLLDFCTTLDIRYHDSLMAAFCTTLTIRCDDSLMIAFCTTLNNR